VLEGMTADGAAAAKRHFEAATLNIPEDPRPAYAYGLALVVQKNPNEALTQFRAAARKTKAPFLPALEALPWVHLSKNDYKQGLPELIELAAKIEESKGNWPAEHDKTHAAEWLGRVIGYLTGPGKSPDYATQIESTAEKIEKTLSGERQAAFDQGRKRTARKYDELKTQAARPIADVLDELRQKREETRTAAQSAAGSIKTIEEEIRTIKKPFDQQISDADKEIRGNGTKAKKLAQDIPDAEDAVAFLSQPQVNVKAVRPSRSRPQGVQVQPETAQQKKARETQLATAKQQLQQIHSSIDNAKQSVTDARAQREQAKADLRKALADKRIELVEAQRVAHDLAVAAKDAERALQDPEAIKSRVTAFESYVPLDPETEKTRLLATLK
jgi:predicted  nucleic acid-binding Zn-ribbon protein